MLKLVGDNVVVMKGRNRKGAKKSRSLRRWRRFAVVIVLVFVGVEPKNGSWKERVMKKAKKAKKQKIRRL